jgi:hypothetical protein
MMLREGTLTKYVAYHKHTDRNDVVLSKISYTAHKVTSVIVFRKQRVFSIKQHTAFGVNILKKDTVYGHLHLDLFV